MTNTLASTQRKQAIKKSLASLIGNKEAQLAIKGKGSVDVTRADWM